MQIVRPFALDFADYTVNIAETDAPTWLVGTTYALGDQVIRNHKVYVSTIASNLGNDPDLENQNLTSARWLFISNTNAYRFMDGTIANKTTSGSTVTIDVANVAGLEAIVLFGMRASTIQVQGFDGLAAEVFNETASLSGRTVYTYYTWLTEPLGEALTKLVVNGFPGSVQTLTITITGSAIEIGEIVIGDVVSIGTALMEGTEGEVKSYSRSEFNDYGYLKRISGPTRNIMRYRVLIPAAAFPVTKELMDRLAGELVGAIGSENRQSTVQLGVLGAIKWSENLPRHYIISFQVDGVI